MGLWGRMIYLDWHRRRRMNAKKLVHRHYYFKIITKKETFQNWNNKYRFIKDTHLVFFVFMYLIGQNFGGQKCRKSGLLPKILSPEKICPPKWKRNIIWFFSADKTAEISSWCRKFLSAENFCPPKILSDEECGNWERQRIVWKNTLAKEYTILSLPYR